MTRSPATTAVLERFREKCRMAGGPRAGYVLRREAVLFVQDRHADLDLEVGVSDLLEQGLLKASESGDFLFLTAAGVEALEPSSGTPGGQTAPS